MTDWSENIKKQDEEIEALSSIYGNDWCIESDVSRTFRIRVEENKKEAELYVTMPPEYPSMAPPKLELSAPWMERKDKSKLHEALNEVYLENVGETVIYQSVEKLREMLYALTVNKDPPKPKENVTLDLAPIVPACPEIIHGEVIIDRKSIFQGHLAIINTAAEAMQVLAKLKENKKIKNATHNMWAYRIPRLTPSGQPMLEDSRQLVLQDYDDDGEDRGGSGIARLLQLRDIRNAIVVVSRWYGGIKLGPDRFHHITAATKQVLELSGMLKKADH